MCNHGPRFNRAGWTVVCSVDQRTDFLSVETVTKQTMYAKHYTVARFCNHCYHVKAAACSLFIVVIDVVVSNTEVFSFSMVVQQWFPFHCCHRCGCQQYRSVQCCHGSATVCSLFIVVIEVVSNTEVFSVVLEVWKCNNVFLFHCCHRSNCQQYRSVQCCHGSMEVQQCVPFSLLS